MAQEIPGHRLGIWGDVENLAFCNTRVRAGSDVPNGVAAGFARRQSRVGKSAHRVLDLGERHEMELHVLSRGDVGEPARIAGRDAREGAQLRCCKDPLWNLHTQHVDSFRLTLPVGAPHKTELAPVLG